MLRCYTSVCKFVTLALFIEFPRLLGQAYDLVELAGFLYILVVNGRDKTVHFLTINAMQMCNKLSLVLR